MSPPPIPDAVPNIVDEIAAEKVYGPIYSAQYQEALRSARANELGHRLGIAPEIVDADIPNMMAADRLNRAVAEARRNRAYARIMSNHRLAAAGIDDQHLPRVASAVDNHRNFLDFSSIGNPMYGSQTKILAGAGVLGGRILSGFSDLLSSASGLAHGLTDIADYNAPGLLENPAINQMTAGFPLALKLFGSAHDQISAIGDKTRVETSNRTFNDVASGIESLPSNVAALAATAAVGPLGGAAVFGGQAFGDAYEEGRKAGLDPNRAGLYGLGDAAIMGGTMFLPEKYLGGAVAGKGGALKGVASGVGLMQAATALEGLNRWYFIERPQGVSFDQFVSTLPDQLRSSFVSTVTALGLTAGGAHLASRIAGHGVDTQAAANVDSIMEAAKDSPTRKTNPSDFEAALNQLVGDTGASDLYVPADKVMDLFQPEEGRAERDLKTDPFWSQYASQIEEASTLGGDVVVPLSAAATHLAGSSDWAALRDHVRSRPGGASIAEVQAAQSPEELANMAAEVAQQIDEATPTNMKAQALTDIFAEQLGYKGDEANAISQLLAHGLSRAYAVESAKRTAAGEPVPSLGDFAETYLPEAQKTTQAAFDAQRGVTAEAAQGELNQPAKEDEKPKGLPVIPAEMIRRILKGGAALPDTFKQTAPDTEEFRRWSNNAPSVTSEDASTRTFKTGKKIVAEGFHGTARPDRIGERFLPERATAGPMAYFTSDPHLASNYATNKSDTSIESPDYSDWFKVTVGGRTMNLDQSWLSLPATVRIEMRKLAPRVQLDDETGENIELGPETNTRGNGSYDHEIKAARGNVLKALVESWLSSGSLFDQEDRFLAVLRLAGMPMDHVQFDSPHATYPAVLPVWIAMKKPLVTSEVPADVEDALNKAAEAEAPKEGSVYDSAFNIWDKRAWSLKEWVEQFNDPESRQWVWTRIPDAATDVLRSLGYDGIVDWSGKGGGTEVHPVYVPFSEGQVKSRFNRGTFDPNDPNILRDTHARGNISIARDQSGLMTGSVIRAFEKADFSTGVHEIGHFFLEDLKRRALRSDATPQEQADWQAVKDWMGENGHTVADDNIIPESGHETFARGFERYIYEGKAPSIGLKSLFAKMRDFMVSLYRSIRSFNAPINPKIREVMDRLLASDDEIAARQKELRLGDQALTDLMSEEEQAKYAELGDQAREIARDTVFDRVLSTLRAQRTRDVSRQKSAIRQEISDQVDQQPVFRVLRALRSGLTEDDGTTKRVALPKQWLVDTYGEGVLSKLPHDPQFRVSDGEQAVDPEQLAKDSGFDSADQMVHKLIAHEDQRLQMKAGGDDRSPRRALVETMTSERMTNEIGDPYANLEEEADAALANEKQADRLSLELRALSRKTGGQFAPWQLANKAARVYVRDKSSKDAISGAAIQMYSRSAAKAAQRVEEALAGQDYEAAFRAKQQQVWNLALMKQAKDAKDEVLKAVKRLRNVAKKATIASVDQDYLDQAHQLLESVDMKTRPGKAVDKRMAFEAWHQKQVEMEIDPVVPPEYRAMLGQTHWSRLSINSLLDLDQAVKQIVKLGRLKQELKDGKKSREFNEGVSEMQDRGGQVPPRKRRGSTSDPRKSPIGRAASRIRSIDAAMVKTEQLAIWLDNNDPNGPWQRLLYRPFADAQGRQSDLMRDYGKDLNDLIKAYPKEAHRSLTRAVDTPELVIRNANHLDNGEPFKGTKDQVLMMALNWGNLGNRQRLLDGYGWSEDAVASVFDRVMTKDDWDFVQGVWDTVDKLWPDVAKLEREVNGIEPEKVEAEPIETPHGSYKGGYFPIVYDPMQTTHTAQVAEDKIAPSGGWWSITTRSSATKERAEQVKGRPLLLSLSVITHHMNEVIHDITHRQAVSQAKRLLGDQRVAGVINTRMGPEYLKAARNWVENVARPNAAYSRENPAIVGLARYLNKAVTTIGLGFRVTVSFKQLLGIPFSARELGSDNIAKGMGIVMSHPVQAYNEMLERSSEMRARSDALDASIEDMHNDLATGKLKAIGPRGISKYAFQGIVWMDVVSRTTVWTSAYNKAISEGMGDGDAVYYADRAVRQSHGIGFQKDRAAIQYGHPFARALWPFFSYLNALYNAQRDVGHRFARAETGGDYAEAARRAWWVFAVPALLQAIFFEDGPQDKDGKGVSVGDWADYLGQQVVLGNLASVPLVGPIAQAVGKGFNYRAISYQQIGEDIAKAIKQDKAIAKGDAELSGSAIKSTLNAAGAIAAKPLGQIGATGGFLYDYEQGKVDPHGVGDWYNGLTRGYIPNTPTAAERLAGRKE